MLKSDADERICPFGKGRVGGLCNTNKCMGWDEWLRPNPEFRNKPYVPMDPRQGDCGLKMNVQIETN